jgi:hypothetical protein
MKNVTVVIPIFIFMLCLGCKKEDCTTPIAAKRDYYLDYTDPIINPFLDNFMLK